MRPPSHLRSSKLRPLSFSLARLSSAAAVATALIAASGVYAPSAAKAANGDWNIDANTTGWSVGANWVGNVIAGGTAGDIANFNFAIAAARTISLDGDRILGTINMNGPAGFGYTLVSNVGGSLILDNGVGTAAINFTAGSVGQTIQAPIVLNSNLEISSSIAGGQTFAGNITGVGRSITIDSNGAHPAGTTNTLGDIIFRGINSYTGGTTVTEARLQAYHGYSLGTGAVTVNDGGGIYMPSGGNWSTTFNLTGLGWNEATGLLGALRVDANSVFTGTINIVVAGGAPTARINAHGASTSIFNGVIAGGATDAMEFTTSAAVTSNFIINNTNTNTGTTRIGRATVAAGTTNLQIGNNNTSGQLGSGDVNIDAGGVLIFNRTDSTNFANAIVAGAGAITQAGIGSTTLTNASIQNTGGWNATGLFSKLTINPGGVGGALTSGTVTGISTLSNYADLEINTSSNVAFNAAVNGVRGSYLIQSGSGTITLGGTTDNSAGHAIVNSGTLLLAKTSAAAVHGVGAAFNDIGVIVNGGTLQLGGTGNDQIFDQTAIRMTAGTFDLAAQSDTMGTLLGAAGSVLNSTAATTSTLTLNGNSGVLGLFDLSASSVSTLRVPVFGGVISDGTGIVAVSRGLAATAVSGPGLQVLAGFNTYSGATNVHTGILSVTGGTLATGAVNVNASATGAGTLAGSGSVGNVTVAVNSGANVAAISPGATGLENDAAATLTANSLTMNGGTLKVNFGNGSNDVIAVTNAATFTGGTVTPLFTSAPGVAPVTFLTSGTLTGAPTLAGVPLTTRGVFGIAPVGSTLTLTNTVASQALTWSGGTTAWDLNITSNWDAGAEKYFNLDAVTFSGTAPGTVVLAAGLHPSAITVNAAAGSDYNFITGTIVGNAGITKSNTGNLTISTVNTFTGDVNITGGIVIAANGAALGSTVGQTYVSGGGTLDIGGQNLGAEIINIAGSGAGGLGALVNNGAANMNATQNVRLTADATVGGSNRFDVRGTGVNLDLGGFTLMKTGVNQFSLVGANVTDGSVIVNAGNFSIETSSVVQGTGTITYNAGTTAQFFATLNGNVTRPMVMDGNFVENVGQNNTVNSPITTSGAITFQGNGGTHNFTNSFTETAATSLTKNGTSTYNIAGNVNYTGATTVTQGTLQLGILNAAAASAVNSVNIPDVATLGAALPNPVGTVGNLQLGTGGYTTITNAPSTITINNGTFGINTRVSNTIASTIVTNFFCGTNQINILSPEQDTTTTLTGAVGSSTQFGRLNIQGGTVVLSPTSSLKLNHVQVNSNNGAGGIGGTAEGILNITGGNHIVQSLYIGDQGTTGSGANSSGIVNMTGGTLTFQANGAATLADTNNSGYAMFGVDGLRIGHWPNNNSAPNQVNLSAGTIDASQTTVNVGWDGSANLNITGGTLKARTLYVDGSGASLSPIVNRMDVSGGATIELGFGGMPTSAATANSSINTGTSLWVAKASSDWTRGMNLTTGGTMTVDTDLYRVGMTGQMVGAGNLTKNGNGILHISGANITTGAINANAGLLRMANAQALGDGTVTVAGGATLDINGQVAPGAAIRPSSITFGGTGTAGSLGGIINSSGTTGGIGVDAGGTITISADTTVYAVGRLEFGSAGAGLNPIISGGASNVTKNGQGQLIWRGTSGSTIGNIVINGGHFYAEEQDNSLGAGGTITANPGGAFSAWQSDGTTSQDKAIVLNGGALMADRNSVWTGGMFVTANSLLTRNAGNADVALTFDSADLDLGGFTLTKRDRSGPTTFLNNVSSGNGTLDIVSGPVTLSTASVFDGTGKIKVRTDGSLIFGDATASVTKHIELAGGSVTENLAGNVRNLATGGVNVISYGYLGALDSTGTINPGAITLVPNAGLTFGSGTGYTALATPGTAMGVIAPTSITGGLATANPNLTVSSNTNATTGNDTTFATWTGTQYTGVAPTKDTIVIGAAGPTDTVMVTGIAETVSTNTTIASLITEQTITITGATLTLNDGGLILRELGTGGWTGTGSLNSGRADGVLALTTTNHFDTVGAFTAGTVSNLTTSGAPAGFRPVILVKNGPGNIALAANSTYTGGTIINSGRLNFANANAYGPGVVTIRDGGTAYAPLAGAYANTFSVSGIGMTENAGVLGALRVNTSLTGCISLDSATARIHTHGGETGNILGNITGANVLEKTGAGNLVVRSAVDYTGATILGNVGGNLGNGNFTAFSLADGGTASSIGASPSTAPNLVFQSGTLNYIGGGASTNRLFRVAPNTGNVNTIGIGIANNGFGNLNFTGAGAIAMNNGATDVTLTLTANNYTTNTFSPTLANPAGARLNLSVAGPGSWELNGASYEIAGTVALTGGADLILNTVGNLTIPVFTTAGTNSYIVKNGANILTLGGSGLLAENDNVSGMLVVNNGTVIFDKRGNNAFTAGSAVGPGTGGAGTRALGGTGSDGLVLNGGTVLYSVTGNSDQIFDQVDVRINGGTMDLNGRSDTFDSLNGSGGTITNGVAGTVSILGLGANLSQQAFQFTARANYGGVIQDGLGQMELVKAGNGVQVLSGANTYTGKTAILNGFLSIDSEDRLGVAPASFVLNQLTFASPNANSGGGLETLVNVTIDDANRGVWAQNNESGMRPAAGTTLNFATPIAGPGGLQLVGEGGVTLSGANCYTGTTAIYRGTLTLDYATQNNSKLANGAALVFRGGNVVLSGGSHAEVVSGLTVDGNGQNAGSTYVSRTSGTSVLNLNGLTRANGTIGGTMDIAAVGIANTDTNNTNSIITGAGATGFTGVAYATFGKNTWATSIATGAADTLITGLATYQANNFATATNHVDVSGAQVIGANSTVSTLRFNNAGVSSIGGAFTLALNQQGILAAPGSGAASINVTTLSAFAGMTGPTTAANITTTTDLVIHQHSSNPLTINSVIPALPAVAGTGAGVGFTTTVITGLTKAGAGTLILTGANTYTGTTHINEGILELQGGGVVGANVAGNAVWVDGTFSLNRVGDYTINNNMGGGGGGSILKTNTGITTLAGGIGTYSGGAVVSQGTLVTTGDAFSTVNQINDNPANNTVYGTITLGDGNTGANNVSYLSGRGVAHIIRKNIVVTNTGSAGTAVIGAGTGTASIGFAQSHQGNVEMNRTTILRGDTTDRLTFSGVLSGNVGTLTIDAPNVAGVVINTNPGRVTLENNNTYVANVGGVVVNGAILQVGSGNIADPRDQIPDASNVQLNGVSAAKQAGLTLNGDSETINDLNGDVNTFIQSAASSSAQMMRLTVNGNGTFSGLFHGGNNTGMTLEKAGVGTTFTLAGTADNNSGRVLVSGGTLQLAKTSSGSVHAAAVEVTVTGGRLLLGGTGGDQIWNNTPVTMYGGEIDLGGVNEDIQSLYGTVGNVTNSVGASTLTLGTNNGSSLFGGMIVDGVGTLAISKTGNGGAIFTGANSYSGLTTISGGFVQIGNGGTTGSIGAGNVVTSANTQLVVNRSNNVSLANTISGGGSLTYHCGNGSTLTLTANNTYSGGTYISQGGILEIGNGGATGDTGTGNITNYGQVRFNRNNALGMAAAIAGSGSVTQAGTGTTTLTANNTYTGLTTVSAGTLVLNTAGLNAIEGNLATDKVTDILINGGTLRWDASNQVGDKISINMTSGSLDINGKTETLYDLTNSGGLFTTGIGGITNIPDPDFNGGINTFAPDSVSTWGELNITDGNNTVQGKAGPDPITFAAGTAGAILNVGALGGLNFSGTASPNLKINSDPASEGKVVLEGNVTSTVTAGQASITNAGADTSKGTLDLNGANRTVSVADGTDTVDMLISADIVGGVGAALTKTGAGRLALDGAQEYLLLTTNAGKTDVNGAFTNGTATVNANATTNFTVSQTIGALNIADGVVVTLGNPPPASPAEAFGGGDDAGVLALGADFGGASIPVQGVPEPGVASLLFFGALGLLGRRRAKKS